MKIVKSRNPLKSGQCFLLTKMAGLKVENVAKVAIPSNRVNVSYTDAFGDCLRCCMKSQSPQIGSMFPTVEKKLIRMRLLWWKVRSQSPQIGSMFPTIIDNAKL